MADTRKEQERDELHKAIWSIADDLRGSVDGWDFKSYVLSTMFYRFIIMRRRLVTSVMRGMRLFLGWVLIACIFSS